MSDIIDYIMGHTHNLTLPLMPYNITYNIIIIQNKMHIICQTVIQINTLPCRDSRRQLYMNTMKSFMIQIIQNSTM